MDNLNLPSKEEYISQIRSFSSNQRMSEPKYRCPSCKEGGMCRNEMIVLCSYPPQNQYECNKCGHIDVYWG
jgi:hypothetical protein